MTNANVRPWTLRCAHALFASSVAALMACAPPDESADTAAQDRSTSSAAHESPTDDFPQSGEKALRKDYCCAVKNGNHVKQCSNIYATKAVAALACRAPLSDNVLRDGQCSQYASCDGKTGGEPTGVSISIGLPDVPPPREPAVP